MKYLIPLLLLLMGSVYCPAQTNQPGELHFNFLDVKGGLPEGFVWSMIQDRQGYIWMTTSRGLVRYDGYKPKVYTLGISDPYRMYVIKVYQDRKGRIWAGTWYGDLYLYDPGKDNFIHYPLVSTTPGSASETVAAGMQDDSLGRLWITVFDQNGQHSSVILFDPVTGKITQYGRYGSGKNHIDADLSTIYPDKKGHIWMSGSNGLYEFNNKNEQFINQLATTDPTKQKGFSGIIEDASQPGVLWFTNAFVTFGISSATNKGLWNFSTGNNAAAVFSHNPTDASSIASDTVLKVMNDAKGNLWVGTMSGLSLFDRANNNFINYYPGERKSLYYNSVIDILEDKAGNFWCQTGMGILYFDTQTRIFTRIIADPKKTDGLLSNDLLHTFLLDQRGTLWLGVSNGGVQWVKRQPTGFIQYNVNQTGVQHFPGGEVQGFAKAADGTVWLGSRKGLYRWEPEANLFTKIPIRKDQLGNEGAVGEVKVAKDGKIWFAVLWGQDNGLNCFDPRTGNIEYYRHVNNDAASLVDNNVVNICEDHLGNIWVGTAESGICRLDPVTQKFTRFPFVKGIDADGKNNGALDDAQVLCILEDKNGTLWIGTNSGGLNRFNAANGTFTSYKNIVPGFQSITGIYEDSQNRLWVGSYYGGFFLFDRETGNAEKFTEKDGLLYDGANAILEDSSHNLWLTSARGISIFNPQTQQVRTLTTANGLPVNNLNNFVYGIKVSNRQFLLSEDNGFIAIDPEDFKPDPNAPVVHIESVGFTVPGSKPIRDSTVFAVDKKNINLSYNENRLSFAWVGLHYQEAGLVQYAYQLEGYDKEWIQAGTQRTVTYINLSPGTYTFRVKAANSSGVWSTDNPSLIITIHPPWWQRLWAWLIYVVLFIAALWAFITYRARHLKRTNQVLEEKVSHRTQQLNKSLDNLKATQSQLIQSEKMASLGELTAGIAHEIQNPLNFMNNFSEVNKELLEEMKAELDKGNTQEAKVIADDVINNEEKINHHGKRADSIVKGMLQHSRSTSAIKEPTDINALADEYIRLSYHGLRAKDSSFNATIKTDFDDSIGKISIVPQDIGRVLLNLYNNAFYAVNERKKKQPDNYEPTVTISTRSIDSPLGNRSVEIKVIDNGGGIPQKVVDKIFQPFFTTKPTGQGTGLGLSLSYDIIKAHGGEIKVETKEARPDDPVGREEATIFIINLPGA
ncbi:MAG: two-component regulator propeller domain-containing protein [Chitinophagaceae bacterium]